MWNFKNNLKYFTFIILVLTILSCKESIENNSIYKDILGQLIVQNDLIPFYEPPSPYFVEKDSEQNVRELKERINYLEERVKRIEDFLTKEHQVYILEKLLSVDHESFKKHDIGTYETRYDTIWIGNVDKRIKNGYIPKKINSLNLDIPFYKIEFVNEIPNHDTSFYKSTESERFDKIYIQLSEIILNKDENRGFFYYAISDQGNIGGFMKYCYIEKVNNKWVIKKKK